MKQWKQKFKIRDVIMMHAKICYSKSSYPKVLVELLYRSEMADEPAEINEQIIGLDHRQCSVHVFPEQGLGSGG